MFIFKKGEMVHGYQIIDKFETTKSVFLVSNSSNEKFVMKALEGGMMSEEIKIGSELGSKCPFLVKVFDVFQGEDGDEHVYIIMEYCEEGDLSKRIEKKIPPTDAEIYRLLYEGTEAINTLHKAGVIHRDIKAANFFILKLGGYKLGDYGVARILDSIPLKTMTHVGTDGYISPEIMEGEKAYTNKTDIYSFGVTILEFILSRHPYSNDNGILNMARAVNCNPIPAALSNQHPCAKLALRMIAKEPSARPSAEDILSTAFPLLTPFHALYVEHTMLQHRLQVERAGAEVAEVSAGGGDGVRLQQKCAALEQEVKKLRAEIQTLKDEKERTTTIAAVGTGAVAERAGSARAPEAITNLPLKFLANPLATGVTHSEDKVEWKSTAVATFFVDHQVITGEIIKIIVECNGHFPCIGLVDKSMFVTGRPLWKQEAGCCCIYHDTIKCGRDIFVNTFLFKASGLSTLGLELNSNTHNLYFFVNGVQQPYCVASVPSSVHFAVGGSREGLSFKLKVLSRLSAPSVSPTLKCKGGKWK